MCSWSQHNLQTWRCIIMSPKFQVEPFKLFKLNTWEWRCGFLDLIIVKAVELSSGASSTRGGGSRARDTCID